jgi:NAD(P)-dependent dehydrogenase (short-subunit alcohol dehydrogenase family)
MNHYQNKTAFITGGGSGIGKALALRLSAKGAKVCIADINHDAAVAVAAKCGPFAEAVTLDVRDAQAVQSAIATFAEKHARLDFLFNNAGIGVGGEANEIPLPAWQRIVDINVYGVLNGVLAAYPIMLEQGYGHIINTASLAGLGPAPLLAPYALTKHAVVGLSTSLRIEAAPKGIKVSVLCPAAIETPILDNGNPKEFNIKWNPDMRRFLSALAGPPYSVEKCAEESLVAIEKNKGIIVLPGRARFAWILGRMSPKLVEKASANAVLTERKSRS